MFIRNAWYAAALSSELGKELFARTVVGEALVLYRDAEGRAHALEDRCAHRQVPLSRGRLMGSEIECWYHGMRFASDGRCTHIPSQKSIPKTVRSYPVAEKDGFVWLWMGDPAQRDDALIPAHDRCSASHLAGKMSYVEVPCDYRFGVDNILDFSHAAFVHVSTIASPDLVSTQPEVAVNDAEVRVRRELKNEANSPLFKQMMGLDVIDRVQEIVFWPIGNTRVETTAYPPGRTDGALRLYTTTIFTPATATSSHVFVGLFRDFALDKPELTDVIQEQVLQFIGEDRDVGAAQQANWREDRVMVNLGVDQAPLAARRMLARLASAEQRAGV